MLAIANFQLDGGSIIHRASLLYLSTLTRAGGHAIVFTPLPLHTTRVMARVPLTLQRCSFYPSSSSALFASLRAAAIERAYACSAARVVPARVGAAAVAEATRGAERPPRVSEGGGR